MVFAPFNIALQVVAAFVIFILGYVALFVSLIICLAVCLAIGSGVYEGTRRVRAYAVRSAPSKTLISSDVALISGLDSGV
jgi:hypothetical protein